MTSFAFIYIYSMCFYAETEFHETRNVMISDMKKAVYAELTSLTI